jgi:PBP1b-binding outer membrane lipoprotein LpoB
MERNLIRRVKMKKVISLMALALMLNGCAALEQTWEIGKEFGSKILNDETKDRLEPYVDTVETVYGEIQEAKK